MTKFYGLLILILLTAVCSFANDTLYFRLSNFLTSEKSATGNFTRKCIKEKDYYHCLDYSKKNRLLAEGYFTDTNFTTPALCQKLFDQYEGYIMQTRCYKNGLQDGYDTRFNSEGDTIEYKIYDLGKIVKEQKFGTKEVEEVVTAVEIAASYPGGWEAFMKYVNNNIKYPAALKEKITGKVFVSFIIDKQGFLAEVQVIKGLHPQLDEEAMRVIKKSSRWNPAMKNGKAVASSMHVPVSFR